MEELPTAVPEARPLRINEPMYFLAGGNDELTARFQISFSYRFFPPLEEGLPGTSLLEKLHLGYTQTSVMELDAPSAPFRDSSYRPSLYLQHRFIGADLLPGYLRVGIEHESNGRAGPENRAINTVFAWSAWSFRIGGSYLFVAPKVYTYLTKAAENGDIQAYRGYGDYRLAYGRNDGWMVSLKGRLGTSGKGSIEAELSYPVREEYLFRLGGYFMIQAFAGYGETILGYDRRKAPQIRIGYAIVR